MVPLLQYHYHILHVMVHIVYSDFTAAHCPLWESFHQAINVTCFPRELYPVSPGLIRGMGGGEVLNTPPGHPVLDLYVGRQGPHNQV